jgi:hypothetical protein
MATNGKNGKSVVTRDEHGRWLKGFSGGPGRPLGSRNKLNEDFLCDLHAAWLERGNKVLDRVIAERPEVFLQAINRFVALDITNPAIDFLALATSMGVCAQRVDRAGDIAPAIEASIASGVPNLIEIPISAA